MSPSICRRGERQASENLTAPKRQKGLGRILETKSINKYWFLKILLLVFKISQIFIFLNQRSKNPAGLWKIDCYFTGNAEMQTLVYHLLISITILRKLCFFSHLFRRLPLPHPPTPGDHQFVLCIYESISVWGLLVLFFSFHKYRYLSLFLWLISLSLIPSRSIHFVVNCKMWFFFIANVPFYVYIHHIFFIHSSLGTWVSSIFWLL